MKIDVYDLIKKRCEFAMGAAKALDAFIDDAIKDSPYSCCFVTTDSIFQRYRVRNNKTNKYYNDGSVFAIECLFA